jgi:hypothetical protein
MERQKKSAPQFEKLVIYQVDFNLALSYKLSP